jgi:hypothetical protein
VSVGVDSLVQAELEARRAVAGRRNPAFPLAIARCRPAVFGNRGTRDHG